MPSIATSLVALVSLVILLQAMGDQQAKPHWIWPMLLAGVFSGWIGYGLVLIGPAGFLHDPLHGGWSPELRRGVALGIAVQSLTALAGWALLRPRAVVVGMKPGRWAGLVVLTGGVGLALMFARCLYGEQRRPSRSA